MPISARPAARSPWQPERSGPHLAVHENQEWSLDHCHPTREGHGIIAEELSKLFPVEPGR